MSPASSSPPSLLSSAYILLRPATRARLAAPRIRLTIAAPEEDDFDENDHPVVIVPQDTCIGGPGGGEETLSVTGTVGYVPIGVYAPSTPPPSVSEALWGCGCTNKQ
ncbi:hypothetical protein B0H14DRAFT_2564397 [Mycena olivaceomarginata]|nr:hypothetical protein B0H14DRAFT_2564397 [Mycena olivaceomarginata]